jgi:phage tail sheath protein FI
MAVSPTYPGVYVQEVPSGVRTIVGVSTSTALFVGFTRRGPVSGPVLCTSYSDYVRAFGDDVTAGDMTRQVKLFFLNGGTLAYVLRVAEGAAPSQVDLGTEDTLALEGSLQLQASDAGVQGDLIRAAVTYSGTQPEDVFNLELFRWQPQSNGTLTPADPETVRGLSMDPGSPAFAPDVIDAVARLVNASSLASGVPQDGTSYSMYRFTGGVAMPPEWAAIVTASAFRIEMSIEGSRYVAVDLPLAVADEADAVTQITTNINTAFVNAGLPVPVGLDVGWQVDGAFERVFIRSSDGNVFVRRATASDAASALLWGSEQGGIEVTRFADQRPAPNGVVFPGVDFGFFETLLLEPGPGPSASFSLDKYAGDGTPIAEPVVATWTDPPAAPGDEPDRLRVILRAIRDAINNHEPALNAGESWPWFAELWGYRLAILPRNGPIPAGVDDNRSSGFVWTSPGAPALVDNVRYYSLGSTGAGAFQGNGIPGADGTAPSTTALYDDAYEVVRREVDLFNLLVLPRSIPPGVSLEELWAAASVFCQERRAFLLMEPPPTWTGFQTPASEITTLRTGVSRQYAALYYPYITYAEDRTRINLGATGAMAGLMARIDGEVGVWKAPAGSEADLRGVVGVAERLSDTQNGVLNPRGINVIRARPTGIVSWGARTLDGDDNFASEYKYVPVRRLALFLEESLYRGLQWVVFQPNAEPLWAQIRLNVGAFMQGLFRRGAFQGVTPQQAYFVKCDAETTPQADRNLGIVNIWVGFAPLNPAEFVVLSIQQMAGQVEV